MIKRAVGYTGFAFIGVFAVWTAQLFEVSGVWVVFALIAGVMIGNIGTLIEIELKKGRSE